MPQRLPARLPTERVHRDVLRLGFFVLRNAGPHTVYAHHERPKVRFVLPRHDYVGRHLVIAELKDAGFTERQFLDAY